MRKFTYECEVCSERDTVIYDDQQAVPATITCTQCGATNRMIKLPPRVATQFHPSKRRKG